MSNIPTPKNNLIGIAWVNIYINTIKKSSKSIALSEAPNITPHAYKICRNAIKNVVDQNLLLDTKLRAI